MIKKLIEILEIQTVSGDESQIIEYITNKLTELNCDFYEDNGNIYATKGNAENYNCIVSHMDTVHPICENLTALIIDDKITGFNKVMMEQTGIGGDDKVGIFIALHQLEKYDNLKCVFFSDEEIGCIGSSCADMQFFNDCNYILQFDRRGNSDFIYNASGVELCSNDFRTDIAPILSTYGYIEQIGLMTDVMQLKSDGLKISCCNLSCGYYEPHFPNEYIVIQDVFNAVKLCDDIFANMTKKYKHKGKKQHWRKKSYFPTYSPLFQCADCCKPAENLTRGLCDECNSYYQDVQYNYFKD